MHRYFHFVAFAITALLLRQCVAGWGLPPSPVALRASVTAVLATIALGGIIESLQHLIYHIQMEWWDVRDDSLAAAAAILLGHAIRAALRRPGPSMKKTS